MRAAWQLDSKSTLVVVDPTSPNILQFRSGADVNRLLSRPFFVELQSRYGNLFYVREEVLDLPEDFHSFPSNRGNSRITPILPSICFTECFLRHTTGRTAGFASEQFFCLCCSQDLLLEPLTSSRVVDV